MRCMFSCLEKQFLQFRSKLVINNNTNNNNTNNNNINNNTNTNIPP